MKSIIIIAILFSILLIDSIQSKSTPVSPQPNYLWGVFSDVYNNNFSLSSYNFNTNNLENYRVPFQYGKVYTIISVLDSIVTIVCDNERSDTLNIVQFNIQSETFDVIKSISFNLENYKFISESFGFDYNTSTLYASGTDNSGSEALLFYWNFDTQESGVKAYPSTNFPGGVFDNVNNVYYLYLSDSGTIITYNGNSQESYTLHNDTLIEYIVFVSLTQKLYGISQGSRDVVLIYEIDYVSGIISYLYQIDSFVDSDFPAITFGPYIILPNTYGHVTLLNTVTLQVSYNQNGNNNLLEEGVFEIATL